MSLIRCGDQACMQYSKCGLIYRSYKWLRSFLCPTSWSFGAPYSNDSSCLCCSLYTLCRRLQIGCKINSHDMVQKICRKVQVLLEGRRNSYVSIKLYEFRNRLESRWQEIFLQSTHRRHNGTACSQRSRSGVGEQFQGKAGPMLRVGHLKRDRDKTDRIDSTTI